MRAMTAVLGVDPLDPHWVAGSTLGHHALLNALDGLVRADLDAREAARKERDYMTADTIRDRLRAAGIAVEDTPDGARWTLDVDASWTPAWMPVNPGVDAGVDQAGGRRGRRPGGR